MRYLNLDRIDRKNAEAAVYYLSESAIGALGLCKTRPHQSRVKLLNSAARARRAAAEMKALIKLLDQRERVLQ